ncbi:hypothetical protein IFVP203_C2100082 [Vibrio parahaemolyticus]
MITLTLFRSTVPCVHLIFMWLKRALANGDSGLTVSVSDLKLTVLSAILSQSLSPATDWKEATAAKRQSAMVLNSFIAFPYLRFRYSV